MIGAIEPALQQPPAALWRGCSLARAQLQRPEHAARGEEGWEAWIAGVDTMQSARAASTPVGVGLMGAPRLASWSRPSQRFCACGIYI
eukprot:scaffold20951_cov53-Phaeocystis_antarctica.AAC.1